MFSLSMSCMTAQQFIYKHGQKRLEGQLLKNVGFHVKSCLVCQRYADLLRSVNKLSEKTFRELYAA